ncbi:hypothetical protein B9Z19DRAFT_1077497 [Tuber borchii]|uniref:Uncharacterized protein n=1 Tax=Tuber borchii TaxID=42251 RepID=A0A2T7A0L7_TUBBO|nr:hypothetical protein B9Z19DRAFT_1077497 [Tuber borchii]
MRSSFRAAPFLRISAVIVMASVPKCLLGTVFCCALKVLVVIFSCKTGTVDQQNDPRLVLKNLSGYSYSGTRTWVPKTVTANYQLKSSKKNDTKDKRFEKVTTHFLVNKGESKHTQ